MKIMGSGSLPDGAIDKHGSNPRLFQQYKGRDLTGQAMGVKFLRPHLTDRGRQGIHLLQPTEKELNDALDRALRDGFDTIWVWE